MKVDNILISFNLISQLKNEIFKNQVHYTLETTKIAKTTK